VYTIPNVTCVMYEHIPMIWTSSYWCKRLLTYMRQLTTSGRYTRYMIWMLLWILIGLCLWKALYYLVVSSYT